MISHRAFLRSQALTYDGGWGASAGAGAGLAECGIESISSSLVS